MYNNLMSKIKIAATGLGGLVGSRIQELLHEDYDFISLTHDVLDITDENQVKSIINNLDFDFFLHSAAYTNVDKAETEERDQAFALNVTATKYLFECVQEKNKKFIYVSTGFVFDGNHPPYTEESMPNPISYYGETKYEGEKIVQDKAMIMRIEYPYRKHFLKKNDFVRTIKQLLEKKKEITAINDSLITPTYIDDISGGLKYLIQNFSYEIFHVVGTQSISPFDAAVKIAQTFNLDTSLIRPVSYENYFKDKAKRPKLAEVKSIKNNFYAMKSFEEGLTELL